MGSSRRRLTGDVLNVATMKPDIAEFVIAHLGQFPDGFAITSPRVELLTEELDRGHAPLLSKLFSELLAPAHPVRTLAFAFAVQHKIATQLMKAREREAAMQN